MSKEIAQQFWKSQTEYPNYGTIKQRRLYELNWLIPRIKDFTTLLDLGCGDGSLIKCLHELTDIKLFFGFDIASSLMENHSIPAILKIYNCYDPKPLPWTDIAVFAGVIPYLFDDDIVHKNLDCFCSPNIYVKAPCSMENRDIYINTFSEKLGSNYASLYRTVPHMEELLGKHFKIKSVERIYPDEIESEFGTKQIAFWCEHDKI